MTHQASREARRLAPERAARCPFCVAGAEHDEEWALGTVFARRDGFPVTPQHVLIIPRRHTPDFFSMTPQEQGDAIALLARLREMILKADGSVGGFNVGMNCGEVAG